MRMLWFTRGREWGLRFLDDGGLADPLPEYERAFASIANDLEGRAVTDVGVALRFRDPLGRSDRSGRPIRHDVVVMSPDSDRMVSFDVDRDLVWADIADRYAREYDGKGPRPTPYAVPS